MRTLIVTADDLGRDEATNAAILRAAMRGIVTRASLLVSAPAADGGVRALGDVCPIGLHLNLTEGRALTGPIRGATDGRGRFLGLGRLLPAALFGRLDVAACAREFEAQVARAHDLGVRPNHLDGHHHVHVFPGLFGRVLDLARGTGVPSVRVPSEPPFAPPRGATAKRAFLAALSRGDRDRARRAGLAVADHFRGLALFGRTRDHQARLLATLTRLEPGVTELMTHPRPGPAGEAETDALVHDAVRAALDAGSVRLSSREPREPRPTTAETPTQR